MFEKKNKLFRVTVSQTVFQILAPCKRYSTASYSNNHRLNMEVDLQSLFGLRVTWCAQLYSLVETPQPPYLPALGLVYEGAIGQQR